MLGGVLTGWIGIGVEKVLFILLTTRRFGGLDPRCAGVTSITVVGWVSLVAAIYHFRAGHVPLCLFVTGMPWILLGATIGPWVASLLGRRTLVVAFMLLIAASATANAAKLGWIPI